MKKRTALLLGLSATLLFLLFLLFQTLSFAADRFSVHPARNVPVEDVRLELNSAAAEEFRWLPGIGPVLSEEIVTWREAHGGFRSVEELLEVPGIGEKTFSGIRDYVYVGGADSDEDSGRG